MTNANAVRWTIFAGILFTVVGTCLLNYYSLFPNASLDEEKKDDTNKNN